MGTQASSLDQVWPPLPKKEGRVVGALEPLSWPRVFHPELRTQSAPAEDPEAPEVISIEKYKDLDAKYFKAEATAREKEAQVYELQKTIMHLNRRDGEASKDDGYFTNQFATIANSIVEWVLAYFRGAEMAPDCSPKIRDKLEPYTETGLLKSKKNRIQVLRSIIAEVFTSRIFGCFLFGAPSGGKEFKIIQDQLRGTDYHIHRWRALTVNLFTQSDGFEAQLTESIEVIAEYLNEILLATFVPKESDEARRSDSLRKLVREAAVLSLEVRRQSDVIELHSVKRGILYQSSYMDDLNCIDEECELEAEGATVQLQVFPVIVRRGYDGDGNFWEEPCIIKKANVLASVA